MAFWTPSNNLVCFKGLWFCSPLSFLVILCTQGKKSWENHRTAKVNLLRDLNSRCTGENLLPGPSDFSKDPRYPVLFGGKLQCVREQGEAAVCILNSRRLQRQAAPHSSSTSLPELRTGTAPEGYSSSCLRAQAGAPGVWLSPRSSAHSDTLAAGYRNKPSSHGKKAGNREKISKKETPLEESSDLQ